VDGKMPEDRDFVIGADVAMVGASNSCLAIYDVRSREKVAEFASQGFMAHEFAKIGLAYCKWFKGTREDGAYHIWESQGPGGIYGGCLLQTDFRNFYYQRNEKSEAEKESDIPGWASTKTGKFRLLGAYAKGLSERGSITNRSRDAILEAHEYILVPGGGVKHQRDAETSDVSDKGSLHGDLVIADALAFKVLGEFRGKIEEEKPVPRNCFAARQKRYQEKRKTKLADRWHEKEESWV